MIDEGRLEIAKLGFREAYNIFKIIVEPDSEEAMKIRFGFKIKFDIDAYYNGFLHSNSKKKRGLVMIGSKWYKVENFFTELNTREKVMKEFILKNSDKISLVAPSGISKGIEGLDGVMI